GPAVAHSREEEGRTDSPVKTYTLANIVYIGAHDLTQIGDLVHEGDPTGKHRVSRILRHLRAAVVHDEDGRSGTSKRAIEFLHDFRHPHIAGPDNHAIRLHEVIDGGTFLEKLGIRDNVEFDAGLLSNHFCNLFCRSYRYCALVNNDPVLGHGSPNVTSSGQNI